MSQEQNDEPNLGHKKHDYSNEKDTKVSKPVNRLNLSQTSDGLNLSFLETKRTIPIFSNRKKCRDNDATSEFGKPSKETIEFNKRRTPVFSGITPCNAKQDRVKSIFQSSLFQNFQVPLKDLIKKPKKGIVKY